MEPWRIPLILFILQAAACVGAGKTFLYFSYASNLLSARIHLQNPSAILKGPALLKDHRLDFIGNSTTWQGAPASIVPQQGKEVWGALWEIDNINRESLDNQEGVHQNIYFTKDVNVYQPDGQMLSCLTYQKTVNPPLENDVYPAEKPSLLYLTVIIEGAKESGLPESYIDGLKNISHNSNYDSVLGELLGLTEKVN